MMPFQKMLKNWKKVGDEPAFRGFYKCCEKCGKLSAESGDTESSGGSGSIVIKYDVSI